MSEAPIPELAVCPGCAREYRVPPKPRARALEAFSMGLLEGLVAFCTGCHAIVFEVGPDPETPVPVELQVYSDCPCPRPDAHLSIKTMILIPVLRVQLGVGRPRSRADLN